MSTRQILRWTMIVVLVIPLGLCTGIAGLNYSGYCFDQSAYLAARYRYLSDDERIRSGIAGVLGLYPSISFVQEEMPTSGKPANRKRESALALNIKGIEITQDQLILYRDAEEFMAVNPDCCNFGRRGLYGEVGDTDFWMKITGFSAGFFNAQYQIRYRDSNGQIQSRLTGSTYHYTNCGHSNPGY